MRRRACGRCYVRVSVIGSVVSILVCFNFSFFFHHLDCATIRRRSWRLSPTRQLSSVCRSDRQCARTPVSMPLSLAELQALAADHFADDLDIPESATNWTLQEAENYFSSGGSVVPSQPTTVDVSDTPGAQLPYRMPIWWTAQTVPSVRPAAFQMPSAHKDTISRVQLFCDAAGIIGAPGEILAASASWDYSIKIWRLADASGAAVATTQPLAVLHEPRQERWVYSVAWCGILGPTMGALGLVSTQTGGMVGEPEHLIRLWSLNREPASGASAYLTTVQGRLSMLVNTEGASASPSSAQPGGAPMAHMHRRGVHAVDCDVSSARMATMSTDVLGVWTLDRSTGRVRELARGPYPLKVGSTPAGLRWLRGGTTLVPIGDSADGASVPLVQLRPDGGLAANEFLAFRGTSATDIVEIYDGHTAGAHAAESGEPASRLVAANANRAFVYDRRAGPQPCARLALSGISGLAAVTGAEAGAPPALVVSTSGGEVRVYDVRKLPEDTKLAKLPPALAELTPPRSSSGFNGVAALGSLVVASDREFGLSVWDVGGRSDFSRDDLT